MLQSRGGDTLGSIMGPMGSHWVQKMGPNRKNYHAPKFEFSTTPRSSIFRKKWNLRLCCKVTVATPLGQSWGQWGPIGSKKWVQTVKTTMLQNSNFRLPRGHRFFWKNGSYVYGAKSRWGPPRVHLGANGVPLGPKIGSKP